MVPSGFPSRSSVAIHNKNITQRDEEGGGTRRSSQKRVYLTWSREERRRRRNRAIVQAVLWRRRVVREFVSQSPAKVIKFFSGSVIFITKNDRGKKETWLKQGYLG